MVMVGWLLTVPDALNTAPTAADRDMVFPLPLWSRMMVTFPLAVVTPWSSTQIAESAGRYVHAFVSVAVPPGVVTTTLPSDAGVALTPAVTVIVVGVLPVIVAATPPSVTEIALERFVP